MGRVCIKARKKGQDAIEEMWVSMVLAGISRAVGDGADVVVLSACPHPGAASFGGSPHVGVGSFRRAAITPGTGLSHPVLGYHTR